MPSIQVRLIDKVLTAAQKKEAIARLKDAVVSIQRELEHPVGLVVIEEVSSNAGFEMWHCLSASLPDMI